MRGSAAGAEKPGGCSSVPGGGGLGVCDQADWDRWLEELASFLRVSALGSEVDNTQSLGTLKCDCITPQSPQMGGSRQRVQNQGSGA